MFTCSFTQLIEVNVKVNSQTWIFLKMQLFLTNDSLDPSMVGKKRYSRVQYHYLKCWTPLLVLRFFQTPYCDKLPINWFFAGFQPSTVSLNYKIVDVVRDWEAAWMIASLSSSIWLQQIWIFVLQLPNMLSLLMPSYCALKHLIMPYHLILNTSALLLLMPKFGYQTFNPKRMFPKIVVPPSHPFK